MPSIKVKRGTRAQLNTAASASGLAAGEPYLITDEGRLAVGTAAGAFVDFAKKSEVDAKQATLVSGTNIKTINGQSVLGAGDITTPQSFRNKIINGDFRINQRGYVSGAATNAGQYTLDRWKVTGTGGIIFSTVNNKRTVTIPSGQTLQQVIEGLNLQTGTYVLSWEGTAQGRIGGGAYGASGTVTAAITGGANTTIEFNAGTVANVQLEVGSVATPFEHRPYGTELALCQRYYEIVRVSAGQYNGTAGNTCTVSVPFKVTKRAAPTVYTLNVFISQNVSSATYDSVSAEGARYIISASTAGVNAAVVDTVVVSEL